MALLHHAWTVETFRAAARAAGKHRHLLLAPLFLALVASSMHIAGMPLGASSLTGSVAGDANSHALPFGGSLRAGSDATFAIDAQGATVHAGSVLVQTDGLETLHVPGGTVAVWNGAANVLLTDDVLTVAALSTPAVVRFGSGVALVPVGMQWSADPRSATGTVINGIPASPLPTSYVAERLADAAAIPSDVFAALVAPVVQPVVAVLSGTPELLDAERAAQEEEIRTLVQAVRSASPDAFQVIASHGDAVLGAGDRGQRIAAALLTIDDLPASVRTGILSHVTDPDLRLLLAAHPALREEGIAAYDGSPPDRVALLRALPLIDSLPQALPEWMTLRLLQELEEQPDATLQAADAIEITLRHLIAGVEELAHKRYANRIALYAHVGPVLAARYGSRLTDVHQRQLALLASNAQLPVDEPQQASAASSSAPLSAAEGERLTEAARVLLQQNGAMFTSRTALVPKDATAVAVQGAVFATAMGDEELSFLLDVPSSQVSGIVRSGTAYGLTVTLQQMKDWLQQ